MKTKLHETAIETKTRVRLEFTAYPKAEGVGLLVPSKFSIFRKMLADKFGPEGSKALDEWMLWVAEEQAARERERAQAEGAKK